MRIQKSIQEGHLKFDNKMKLDGHPFPQNMVSFSVNMVIAEEKGKVKVLTSARAKQDGSVDPSRQVTVEQVHREAPRILKSQVEVGESSRSKPRVTTRIILNKWQRQQETKRYQWQQYEEERRVFEEEAHRRELEEHVLTPKFGTGRSLICGSNPVKRSVRKKEGFFRKIQQRSPRSAICFRSARKLFALILWDCVMTWPERKGRMD
jgi:hypothetical protein